MTISHCATSIMSMPTIASLTRKVNEGLQTVVFSPATWSSNACNFEATYSDAYVLAGSALSRPAFITFNGRTRTFGFDPTLGSQIGVYTITVTASIPQPPSGSKTTTQTFVLTVIPDCDFTSLTSRSISNMSAKVSLSSSQDVTYADSLATTYAILTYCGPRIYSFTQT